MARRKTVSSLVAYNVEKFSPMGLKLYDLLINCQVPAGKKKQLSHTVNLLKDGVFELFGERYQFNRLLDYRELQCGYVDKLRSYELSYFQFCHDLAFGVLDGHQDCRDINAILDQVLSVLKKAGSQTNKHPFWYPYAVSTRLVNLVLFLSSVVHQDVVDQNKIGLLIGHILRDTRYLEKNIEYDSDGNHLLKNYTALFLVWAVLGKEDMYQRYHSLLCKTATAQLLPSGLHFEKSLDYHMLVLHDMFVAQRIELKLGLIMGSELLEVISKMLNYANHIFINKEKPLFHDCFEPSYFHHDELIKLMNSLYPKSGYVDHKEEIMDYPYIVRKLNDFTIIIDRSEVSPPHCPSHSHDNCLHYELWYKGVKFIVDSGNGTYMNNDERTYFRSSPAHNISVLPPAKSQSVLLKTFRFGRTAKLLSFSEKHKGELLSIQATVKGYYYRTKNQTFNRFFDISPESIKISDSVSSNNATNYIHFHPASKIEKTGTGNTFLVSRGKRVLKIVLEGQILDSCLSHTMYSEGFYNIRSKPTINIQYKNKMYYTIFGADL